MNPRYVESQPPTWPDEAAHCASEFGNDDAREPMTDGDVALLLLIVVGSIAGVCFIAWGLATAAKALMS